MRPNESSGSIGNINTPATCPSVSCYSVLQCVAVYSQMSRLVPSVTLTPLPRCTVPNVDVSTAQCSATHCVTVQHPCLITPHQNVHVPPAQCSAMQCNAVQCNRVQCNRTQCSTAPLPNHTAPNVNIRTVQHSATQCNTVQSSVQHNATHTRGTGGGHDALECRALFIQFIALLIQLTTLLIQYTALLTDYRARLINTQHC